MFFQKNDIPIPINVETSISNKSNDFHNSQDAITTPDLKSTINVDNEIVKEKLNNHKIKNHSKKL